MKQIVFASKNPKKVEEIKRMASGVGNLEILSLSEIDEVSEIPQVEETGNAFFENAIIKATYWANKLNMPVIAEDSGLEIEALNGYPGVHTKRCIKQLVPEADINVDKPGELYPILLKLMSESGNPSTKANWVCAMALVDSKNTTSYQTFVPGNMCPCAGEAEFGFDQYFKVDGYSNTLAELSPRKKDEIGPRKKCFQVILSQIS